MKQFYIFKLFTLFFILLTQCGTPQRQMKNYKATITGQGSSFSLPMSSMLFKKFSELSQINIDYISDSSYNGINSLIQGTTDFALSIVPLSDQQLLQNPDILHIPIAAAGINFAYNIPKEGFSLKDDPIVLTPDILVKIFTKKITKWNDPEIVNLNKQASQMPDRVFPNLDITVFQRSVPSGDTTILTTFLSKATSLWSLGITNILPTSKANLSNTNSLDLMINLSQTSGSFTYTTMIYGIQNNIPLARIKNSQGVYGRGCNFRTLEAMKVANTNADNRVDLTYPSIGKESGVATALVYILVKKDQNYNNRTKEQAQYTVDFINWLLTPAGQRMLEPLFFANLTPKFRAASHSSLAKVTYNGTPMSPNTIKKKK